MNVLGPEGIDLKCRILCTLFENPFLEASVPAFATRFCAVPEEVDAALADLCGCRVLQCADGVYRFEPDGALYGAVAALAADHRGDDAALRQQVVEMESLVRLREALAVTHREVAAILEMVPAGVLLLDRYGHLLKSNALARELLGLASEGPEVDVCGRLGLHLCQVLDREMRVEAELERPLSVRSRPFEASGSEAGAVVTVEDITHRREMEARAERLREEFFSMIRHELRKPLLAVDRFLAGLEGELSAEVPGELAQARAAASHLATMVDDMLFLARLERDPMAVSPQDRVSLRFLLAGSDLAYRAGAADAGLRLRMVPPEEDVVFRGDERRLLQAIGNLLDNAIKFTPPGGEVVLGGKQVGEEVRISVSDSGPGIPAEERERVFDRFYQVRSGDGRVEGLGLGLAICHRVARAHGGRIEVSDGSGGGAEVALRFPLVSD